MQKTSSSTKTIIIFVAILLIGVLMYFYTLGNANDSAISSLEQTGSSGNVDVDIIGARVLSLLKEINQLKIDKSIFEDPLYKSLLDHTVPIPPQNIGRANPFEPFSGEVVPLRATTTRAR